MLTNGQPFVWLENPTMNSNRRLPLKNITGGINSKKIIFYQKWYCFQSFFVKNSSVK